MGDIGTITIHVAFIRLLVVLPCAGPRTQTACQARGGAGRSGLPLATIRPIDSSYQTCFEERALLLSRLGRHEVALAIYAHVLKNQKWHLEE